MKRAVIMSFVLGLILCFSAVLFARRIELPSFVWYIVLIVGAIYFLVKTRSRFKSKKTFLYAGLGIILTFGIYIISAIFFNEEPYIVAAIIMILAFLAAIFYGLTAFKMIKELRDKFKK